jgi:type II secretory pathway component HofQ
MTRRLAAALLLGAAAAATAAYAQDKPPPTAVPPATGEPPRRERVVYPVRGGDPAALAELIGKHFRGEVEASAVPTALVLSGSPAAVGQATELLAQVDRRPRSVELEVTLVDAVGAGADLPPGPLDRARLDELVKAGGSVQRVRLTATDGRPVTTQSGGDKPYAADVGRAGPKGAVQRAVSYRPMGTTLKATPRVGADGTVVVDLSVQDSSARPAPAADEVGAPAFETASLSTVLVIPPGKAVVAQATRKEGKDGRTVGLVVVTAKVVEPEG